MRTWEITKQRDQWRATSMVGERFGQTIEMEGRMRRRLIPGSGQEAPCEATGTEKTGRSHMGRSEHSVSRSMQLGVARDLLRT